MIQTKRIQNENGMTLVEILVATVIVTISAVAVLEIIRVAQANLSSVSRQLTYDVVKTNVGIVLNHASDCKAAIEGGAGGQFNYNGNAVHLPSIVLNGDVLVQEKTLVDNVLFKDIIVRPVPGAQMASTATRNFYLAELVINAEKQGDISGPRSLSNENNPYRFYIITDKANKMLACSSSGFLDAVKTCDKSQYGAIKLTKSSGDANYDVYTIGTTVGYGTGQPPPITPSSTAVEICGKVNENQTLTLKCGLGKLVKSVTFANYGQNQGNCPTVQKQPNGCTSPWSTPVIASYCYGHASCSIPATNIVFTDQCGGVLKTLAAKVICENEAKVQIPDGFDPNSTAPIPTPTPPPAPTGLAVYCVVKQGEQFGNVSICIAGKQCTWENTQQ